MKDNIQTRSFSSTELAKTDTQQEALVNLLKDQNKELYNILMKSDKSLPDFDQIQEAIDYWREKDENVKKLWEFYEKKIEKQIKRLKGS